MFVKTPWKIGDNDSLALYLGAGVALGGGDFNFELIHGEEGPTYNTSYHGVGAGIGIGLRGSASAVAERFMNYILPVIRLPTQLASGTLYSTNLHIIGESQPDLRWQHLNNFLILVEGGIELGASLKACLLIWMGIDNTDPRRVEVRRFDRRWGDFVTTQEAPMSIACALVVSLGAGLVGIGATITITGCNEFSRAVAQ